MIYKPTIMNLEAYVEPIKPIPFDAAMMSQLQEELLYFSSKVYASFAYFGIPGHYLVN